MPDKEQQLSEGYAPEKVIKGYQSSKPKKEPTGESKPFSGYIPTTGTGSGPIKNPTPPGDE